MRPQFADEMPHAVAAALQWRSRWPIKTGLAVSLRCLTDRHSDMYQWLTMRAKTVANEKLSFKHVKHTYQSPCQGHQSPCEGY